MRSYITTAIPYVNARPHLGHALELVQGDVLARHRRSRGGDVRFLGGTDNHALKNTLAADEAGVDVRTFVRDNAAAFRALHAPLELSFDDFIETSHDARHRPGVERLWSACSHDLYRRPYAGLYCVGCEQFYAHDELDDGRCPEHGTEPERVAEENRFFALSRYQHRLEELIASGRLRIEPDVRRNEVLAFVRAGLRDFSVSRPAERARGWGIPVPDDPTQVVYVWWDALGNYITALGYGSADERYRRWWTGAGERVHVIGKGILRFHAVYWPAILLSAGELLPTRIAVHDYLTATGHKLSKSSGNVVDPVCLVDRFGTTAVRWWLLRDVPRVGDADFTEARLVERHDRDLANDLGNLVNRTVTMVHRYRDGRVPHGSEREPDDPAPDVDAALERHDLRGALARIWTLVADANRYVESVRPWELARDGRAPELDAALSTLVASCRAIGTALDPFVPSAASRVLAQLTGEVLPEPRVLFPRLAVPDRGPAM